MRRETIMIGNIPAIIWGQESDKVWLCVHGKMSNKEAFEQLAAIAEEKGWQTLSFDLPQHGQRKDEPDRCDIWNGIRDLSIVSDFVFRRWNKAALFACSLGAYFSLHALQDRQFENCLFQSPILDMEYLIRQMMLWFDITEERLCREKEIDTPVDMMSWDYYQYVLKHPVERWNAPAHILFAGKDDLQTIDIIRGFVSRFGGSVQVAEDSRHPFMEAQDEAIVLQWLRDNM